MARTSNKEDTRSAWAWNSRLKPLRNSRLKIKNLLKHYPTQFRIRTVFSSSSHLSNRSIEAAKIINKKQHKLFWRISDVCAHLVSCFSSQLRMTIQTNVWWSAKRNKNTLLYKHTVRNLHFLSQKFNFDFPRKLPIFGGWKTRENVVIFGLFSSW